MDRFNKKIERLEKEIDGTDGRPAFKASEIKQFIKDNPEYCLLGPETVYKVIHAQALIKQENLKINSKSMEIKPGQAEPKSANPLPLLWASTKYLFRHPLARNIIIALLLVAAVLLGGNYLLEKAKLSADRVSVQIKDDKGNMIVNSSLSATLVNIYSNIVDLKARFQVDEKNQVGNIAQFVQEEVAKQLQLKGL